MFFGSEKEKAKRAEWLKTLVVGSSIAIQINRYGPSHEYGLGEVVKCTPSGRVTVKRAGIKCVFNADVDKYSREHGYSNKQCLVEPTGEVKAQIKHAARKSKIDGVKWDTASPEKLQAVFIALFGKDMEG